MTNQRMHTRRRIILVGLASVTALGIAASAAAGDKKDQRRAAEAEAIRAAVARGEVMALPRILALAQARVPGEVLKVELEHDKGRLQYEIKVLAGNGRVREVKLDARTGGLIKIEDD